MNIISEQYNKAMLIALAFEEAVELFRHRYVDPIPKVDKAIEIVQNYLKNHPKDEKALAFLSNLYLERGDLTKKRKEKIEFYKKGMETAKILKQLNPSNPDGYVWYAANLGRIGQTKGVLNSLGMVPEFKKNVKKALELDPNHPVALDAMGCLYYELPSFAGGSLKKSELYLKKAVQVLPNFTRAMVDLAKTLKRMGKKQEAISILEKVINCENPVDPGSYYLEDLPTAKKLLKKLKK